MTALETVSVLLAVVGIVYTTFIITIRQGLGKLRPGTNDVLHTFSILIAARNEEQNIERCLRSLFAQSYPADRFSIIVIDDQSDDRTAEIVRAVSAESPVPCRLISSDPSSPIRSPKVRALSQAIVLSDSDIIITTDADCTAPQDWIRSINSFFEAGVGLVAGLTVYAPSPSLNRFFWGIQHLDFLSYSAVGAGSIGNGRVIMSHGSNMAFLRSAYDACGGFPALAHINSGTDSLLAQRITRDGKWQSRFAFSSGSTITTAAVDTWGEMFRQRLRWVGQTAYYPLDLILFMSCTFIMFLLLPVAIPWTFIEWNIVPWIVLAAMQTVDYLTMRRFSTITGTMESMRYYIPTAVLHIPFILVSTIGGYFFSFRWKQRTMRKGVR